MKEKSENKLDQLFRDGISGAEDHIAFREEDWASMEQLLDKKSNRKAGVFRIVYFAAGIAALLLLAIGLYFYTDNNNKIDPTNTNLNSKNTKGQSAKDKIQPVKSANTPAAQLPVNSDSLGNTPAQNSSNSAQGSSTTSGLTKQQYAVNTPYSGLPSTDQHGLKVRASDNGENKPADNSPVNNNKVLPLIAAIVDTVGNKNKPGVDNVGSKVQNNIAANTTPPDTVTDQLTAQEKKQMLAVKTAVIKNRPQFSISVLAASDANAVNSFGHSQTGTNYGVQLSLKLTRKLTVSTGAAYAIKPYSTSPGSYSSAYPQSVYTTNIQANCKVLDIPLNVSYQVYSKGNNAISLGSGVSSYFMLRENYRYDYTQDSGLDPKYIEIKNQNKHLFGVLNINANYQRRINSRFSAVVQPYMKLPLTGIGNGKVDLKSTGVALGINWNIGSAFGAK
ncbi:hypothetical protein [Mucilaginibacter dorajii]|uniref:Outer membrane protein beta-barrel domain-containing protein n=1 Tax=Mucilaginibacter dorajii TaxID=692994 RepID=A0ABP7RA13_9SPHI|nr:hypothetical protein [Mucilaginibacter dorajii]MCS3737325.1 hypothetical protein [Mucilaginibacter dorajii]